MRPPRIIDAHHHLWDLNRVYYPWLTDEIVPDFLFGDYAKIRKNYLPDDMRRQVALVWEGCDNLSKWPVDNKSCLFRGLAQVLAVVKDTLREVGGWVGGWWAAVGG